MSAAVAPSISQSAPGSPPVNDLRPIAVLRGTGGGVFTILAASIVLIAYAAITMAPARAAIAPWIGLAVAAWAIGLMAIVLRTPTRRIRVSDPGVIIMLWAAYYYLWPAVEWAQGSAFGLESAQTIQLTVPSVARVQVLHALFLLGFGLTWASARPRLPSRALSDESIARLPRGTPFLVAGLLPFVIEAVQRLAATGSLRPISSYGEFWYGMQGDIAASRSIGGGDYILTQIMSKIWFVPVMALGVGLGLLMTRLLHRRDWRRLALLHAAFPVLMYLGPGGRSAVIAPYIIGLVIADLLTGPIPWRLLSLIVVAGSAFFNFYGWFRSVQTQELSAALEATSSAMEGSKVVHNEQSAMLVKEAFAVVWVDSTGIRRGLDYFIEAFLSVLPGQLLPEKANFLRTTTFLSRELLGAEADYGAGVAGAMVADGYMIYGDLGVLVLSIFLALLLAGTARAVLSRPAGTELWRHLLLATFVAECFLFLRSDLMAITTHLAYYIALPALLIYLMLLRAPTNPWSQRLVLE